MLKCIGLWNVECGNPHSNSHSRILEFGIWDVEIHIPHSTFQCTLAWWEVGHSEEGISNSKLQNSGMGIGMWNSATFHIPHSRALQHGEGWDVPTKTIPNSKLQILGIGIWNCLLYSKFHSIPISPFHCGCHKLICNLVQFKFHSNSTVDGMECAISVWHRVLLGASLWLKKLDVV